MILCCGSGADLRLTSHFGEVRSRQLYKRTPRLSAHPAHGDSDVLRAASRGFPAAPYPSEAGGLSSGPTPTEDAVASASKVTGEAGSSSPAAASLRIERRGREHLMGKSHSVKARVLTVAAPPQSRGHLSPRQPPLTGVQAPRRFRENDSSGPFSPGPDVWGVARRPGRNALNHSLNKPQKQPCH